MSEHYVTAFGPADDSYNNVYAACRCGKVFEDVSDYEKHLKDATEYEKYLMAPIDSGTNLSPPH